MMSVISKFGHCFSMRLLPWRQRMRSTGRGISDVRNLGTGSPVYAHIWCSVSRPVCDVSTMTSECCRQAPDRQTFRELIVRYDIIFFNCDRRSLFTMSEGLRCPCETHLIWLVTSAQFMTQPVGADLFIKPIYLHIWSWPFLTSQ